jgi:predicted HicB family RNase H-like nuclease
LFFNAFSEPIGTLTELIKPKIPPKNLLISFFDIMKKSCFKPPYRAIHAPTVTMKNIMRYKGYLARIDYDEADRVFAGNVLGLAERISFHGASVDELRGDFEFAIDHYLSVCREAGVAPQKQAGGRVLLRLPAETHAEALIAAQAAGLSLNEWLQNAVRRQLAT